MRQYLLPQGGQFYKVNMHSHSNLSDGKQTPEEIKEAYKAHGYAAVAFTEHEGLFDLSHLTDDEFIAITSYEYSFGNPNNPPFVFYEGKVHTFDHNEQVHLNFYAKDPHNIKMVCYNPKRVWGNTRNYLDQFEWVGEPDYERVFTVECMNEVIKTARENGFLVAYNHPTWSLNTYPTYSRFENLSAFEIANGGADKGSDLDYTPYVYDQMARTGQRMICVGGDDNHNVGGFFLAWTMIKADKLGYAELIDGLEKGNCYASMGPEIYDLYVEDGKVTVKCSDAVGIYYGSAGRHTSCKLANANNPVVNEATFTIKPEDFYFRISVKDKDGKHANTRIYYLDEFGKDTLVEIVSNVKQTGILKPEIADALLSAIENTEEQDGYDLSLLYQRAVELLK